MVQVPENQVTSDDGVNSGRCKRGRRGRRGRERRKRTRSSEEQPYHNTLTFPILLSLCFMVPMSLILPMVFRVADNVALWLCLPIAVSVLVMVYGAPFVTVTFFRWRVSPYSIESIQPGKYGSGLTRTCANRDFSSLELIGPFAVVRDGSNKRHTWPRWLRRDGITYHWQLEHGQLRLVAPDSAHSG